MAKKIIERIKKDLDKYYEIKNKVFVDFLRKRDIEKYKDRLLQLLLWSGDTTTLLMDNEENIKDHIYLELMHKLDLFKKEIRVLEDKIFWDEFIILSNKMSFDFNRLVGYTIITDIFTKNISLKYKRIDNVVFDIFYCFGYDYMLSMKLEDKQFEHKNNYKGEDNLINFLTKPNV